jgi:hypothetical protein
MSSITITAYCTVLQWCQQHTNFRKKIVSIGTKTLRCEPNRRFR